MIQNQIEKDIQYISKYIKFMGKNISINSSLKSHEIYIQNTINYNNILLRIGNLKCNNELNIDYYILNRNNQNINNNLLFKYDGNLDFLKQYIIFPTKEQKNSILLSNYKFNNFSKDQAIYIYRIIHGL
jgi:hypothetical protein